MLKKYPFRQQPGLKDCGCTCLQMIIEFYNGKIGIEKIRDLSNTTKNGTTAFNLIEAAHQIGFEAKGLRISLEQIISEKIILPCIAHTIINNSYQHFVVIYEIDIKRKKILVADPSQKLKKVSFTEWNQIYNGVIILLYPKKNIPIINEQTPNLISVIYQIGKAETKSLIQLIALSILMTLFSIATTFFIQYMIKCYSKSYLIFIFIIFTIIYIFKIITDYFRNKVLICINQQIDITLTIDTFKNIISLPYHYYKNRTTGEMISKINDLSSVKESISKIILSFFIDLPLSMIALCFLYNISSKLSIIAIIILSCYILIVIIFKKSLEHHIDKIQNQKAITMSYMTECITGFETIKGIHLEKYVIDQLDQKYRNTSNRVRDYQTCYNAQYTIKEIVNSLGFIIIILIGCVLILNNELDIGQLLTFQALLTYFLGPIRSIIDLDTNMKESKNALKRVLEMFQRPKIAGTYQELMNGDIKFQDLDYSFNCYSSVLNKVNGKIKKGNKVMIVGSSGSGKSTLLKILMKYYTPQMGQVFINNIDINHYTESAIKDKIKYISQQETLFTDTMYNNIILNNNDIKKFQKITKMCMLDDIVKKNNLGYQMLIEENGCNISGGERQRIILARTLMKNFDILLIDEGLNEMDMNLERKILKNIFYEYHDKTIIIISHRLENLDLYDQTIKIENGKIVEDIKKNEANRKLE